MTKKARPEMGKKQTAREAARTYAKKVINNKADIAESLVAFDFLKGAAWAKKDIVSIIKNNIETQKFQALECEVAGDKDSQDTFSYCAEQLGLILAIIQGGSKKRRKP